MPWIWILWVNLRNIPLQNIVYPLNSICESANLYSNWDYWLIIRNRNPRHLFQSVINFWFHMAVWSQTNPCHLWQVEIYLIYSFLCTAHEPCLTNTVGWCQPFWCQTGNFAYVLALNYVESRNHCLQKGGILNTCANSMLSNDKNDYNDEILPLSLAAHIH